MLLDTREAPVATDDKALDPAAAEADALWDALQLERAPSPIDKPGTLISKQETFATTDGTDQTLDVLQGIARDGVADPGHVYIYDPETGERSITSGNQLRQQLTKRDPFTNKVMFVQRNPGKTPVRGTARCLLHPENPEGRRWLDMGLKPCSKPGFWRNEAEALRHLRVKHKSQWEVIEQIRQRDERNETREQSALLNRALTALLERESTGRPAPAPPVPQAVIVPGAGAPLQSVVLPATAAEPIIVPARKPGRPKGSRARAKPKGA